MTKKWLQLCTLGLALDLSALKHSLFRTEKSMRYISIGLSDIFTTAHLLIETIVYIIQIKPIQRTDVFP